MPDPRIPYIDPAVTWVGISRLRAINSASLRDLKGLLVIQDGYHPLAVVIPYEKYLELQRAATKEAPDA